MEANIGAVEAHNEAVLANNRDLHHFDEERDLDPQQSEKSDPDLNQRIWIKVMQIRKLIKSTLIQKGHANSRCKPT
jgi:hypothetical protein